MELHVECRQNRVSAKVFNQVVELLNIKLKFHKIGEVNALLFVNFSISWVMNKKNGLINTMIRV
jgi:hypothetical protein